MDGSGWFGVDTATNMENRLLMGGGPHHTRPPFWMLAAHGAAPQ
jgi:hypothetical protein